jgi:pyruvate/2-oxoacid:ferredoxin oxidoreductase beta subunit
MTIDQFVLQLVDIAAMYTSENMEPYVMGYRTPESAIHAFEECIPKKYRAKFRKDAEEVAKKVNESRVKSFDDFLLENREKSFSSYYNENKDSDTVKDKYEEYKALMKEVGEKPLSLREWMKEEWDNAMGEMLGQQ